MNILQVKKILPLGHKRVIEQAKFTYSSLSKAFEKQRKAIEEQREKQIKTIEDKTEKQIKTLKNRVKNYFSDTDKK